MIHLYIKYTCYLLTVLFLHDGPASSISALWLADSSDQPLQSGFSVDVFEIFPAISWNESTVCWLDSDDFCTTEWSLRLCTCPPLTTPFRSSSKLSLSKNCSNWSTNDETSSDERLTRSVTTPWSSMVTCCPLSVDLSCWIFLWTVKSERPAGPLVLSSSCELLVSVCLMEPSCLARSALFCSWRAFSTSMVAVWRKVGDVTDLPEENIR